MIPEFSLIRTGGDIATAGVNRLPGEAPGGVVASGEGAKFSLGAIDGLDIGLIGDQNQQSGGNHQINTAKRLELINLPLGSVLRSIECQKTTVSVRKPRLVSKNQQNSEFKRGELNVANNQ